MSSPANQLIAAIYDGVFGVPFADFQRFALDCTRRLIGFDSAVWINGVDHENQIHNCLLINQPDSLIARYMADYAGIDLVRRHAVRSPGKAFRIEDTVAIADYHAHPAYRDLWGPAGIEHALAVAALDPISQLMELIVLWRSDAAAGYTATDVAALETLAPHITAAWRHRQLAHLHEQGTPPTHVRGNAICDANGAIYASDARFNAAIAAQFAGWRGPSLPRPLRDMLAGGITRHSLPGLDIVITPGEPRCIISVSAATLPLTAAEQRTAALFAAGQTNAQIAASLGITASTVRNQIAAAYRKLDIHSKAELARRIPDQTGGTAFR